MVQFTKLRINGFKSFVDRTELEIAPGLNGIVGPNGCGKSNLVEALRWVMGENSAKRMRGGGMEDVIFNGTSKRAQRNIAEVSLLLDNSARKAPAAYNGSDEIEVTRRIERDRGSNYKINGKNVRMRDVQMLFADTVTGANSPALVSQGRVTQMINAKPLDRRLILEESAGISGLFARRHEAELRLRAADTNLQRIDDVFGSMESRLNGLKRQARQANQYRNLSAQIRQLEVLITFMEWQTLNERRSNTRKTFEEAESRVAEKLGVVTQLTKTQNTQVETLAPLRKEEAEAAAALQTQRIALQRVEDEAGRLEQVLQETQSQLTQTQTDEQHEQQSLSESTSVLEKLEGEHAALIKTQENDAEILQEKIKARDALETEVVTLEEKYTSLMQSEAESKARKNSLEQQIQVNSERLEIVKTRAEKTRADLKELEHRDNDANQIEKLELKSKELEDKSNKLDEDITAAEEAVQVCKMQRQDAREALSEAQGKHSKFSAEISMLESFFEDSGDDDYSPILDSVSTDSGFEKALSRALGDSLMASLDEGAPVRWRQRKALSDMPSLPAGVTPLLPHVKAPKELHLALSQIGFIDNDNDGDAQADALSPGQALVSQQGTYWRWDGFCVRAEATDRNALHLEQKNKLAELNKKAPEIERAANAAQEALEKANQTEEDAEARGRELKIELRQTQEALRDARAALGTLRESHVRYESDLIRLKDSANVADDDIKTLEEVITWDKDRLKAYEIESNEQQDEDIEEIKATLDEAREKYNAAIRAFDSYQQEQNSRKARLHAIADERVNLRNRSIRARERLKELSARKDALSEKLEELKAQPKDFAADKEKLLSLISELEGKRNAIAEKLSESEHEVSETARALKEAEGALSQSREDRAHAQATMAVIQEQIEAMTISIFEQFEMKPEELATHSALDESHESSNLDTMKHNKDKLTRQRDAIGPVNLRAEDEASALEKEVATIIHERNDLMQAIEELREGINKINVEARERLVSAFELVNAHFQRLFVQLFGGGQAHLALIDSEDPLESGLEIFAQPPGKSLQSLSLLSGGEQTMASIALIFGMFLTNPSPICVLDEIDAPLDDANVDRVCNLLEEISERGETRFVIITHHRMTMARMDRLYGVTMAEKGVSQLVSVDLQQSFSFLEAA